MADAPLLVRFRYTLPHGVNQYNIDSQVLDSLVPILRAEDCLTVGYEDKRSDGMPTHPHIHIAFNTKDSLKNIRGRFRTWLKTHQDDRIDGSKGSENKVYSLTSPKDGIENIRRHFRYCWKQGGRQRTHEKLGHLPDWDFDDVEVEEERAKTEYASTSDALAKAKAKAEKKLENSTYTKIKKKCDEVFLNRAPSMSLIQDEVIKTYVDHELSMNTATMQGYALTYGVSKKVVSYDQVKAMMNKHFNII